MAVEVDKVEKRGDEWCVVHCHGANAGKAIKCFPTRAEAEAMHRAIQANDGTESHPMDTQRKIGFDAYRLDDKILLDDDQYLVMPAVIASEIVQRYSNGWAYKPADELEAMAEAAAELGAVPVKILEHPPSSMNYLVVKRGDVYGRAENIRFVKNLMDPKTQRPMRRGVRADIRWFKSKTPERVLNQVRSGELRDVSIGFTFDVDHTAGAWNGQSYDYVQRNLYLQHVAAPIAEGRCPGPVCGIGFDTVALQFGIDEASLQGCPVCRAMVDVGIKVASARLVRRYGMDVLAVLTNARPPPPPPAVSVEDTDLSRQFEAAFTPLREHLQS